jgi:hypothetical protein
MITSAISFASVPWLLRPEFSTGTSFVDAAMLAYRAVAGGEYIVAQ